MSSDYKELVLAGCKYVGAAWWIDDICQGGRSYEAKIVETIPSDSTLLIVPNEAKEYPGDFDCEIYAKPLTDSKSQNHNGNVVDS